MIPSWLVDGFAVTGAVCWAGFTFLAIVAAVDTIRYRRRQRARSRAARRIHLTDAEVDRQFAVLASCLRSEGDPE